MRLRLDKPWQPLTAETATRLPGQLGVYQVADGQGTVLGDRVRYSLPLGPLGDLAHALLVRRDVDALFAPRRQAVEELL